jgi:Melibiase
LLREVDFSAKLGVDVFNMDASWHLGSSKKGTGDWGCGHGHYADDRQTYPSGLASISHRVHEVGMKFGLWVGPNVVDSRIVGTAEVSITISPAGRADRFGMQSGPGLGRASYSMSRIRIHNRLFQDQLHSHRHAMPTNQSSPALWCGPELLVRSRLLCRTRSVAPEVS